MQQGIDCRPAAIIRISRAAQRLSLRKPAAQAPRNLTLLGIDPYGIDYCVDGFRERVSLGDGDFRDVLLIAVELAGS